MENLTNPLINSFISFVKENPILCSLGLLLIFYDIIIYGFRTLLNHQNDLSEIEIINSHISELDENLDISLTTINKTMTTITEEKDMHMWFCPYCDGTNEHFHINCTHCAAPRMKPRRI